MGPVLQELVGGQGCPILERICCDQQVGLSIADPRTALLFHLFDHFPLCLSLEDPGLSMFPVRRATLLIGLETAAHFLGNHGAQSS